MTVLIVVFCRLVTRRRRGPLAALIANADDDFILLKHDINLVSVGAKHTLQQLASTLLGGLGYFQLDACFLELFPRALKQGIAIGPGERVPQPPLLVVSLHFPDLNPENARLGQGDRNSPGFFINLDRGIALQVDSGEDLSGYNYKRSFGRAVPGIFVYDHIP
jgi:hypothetical protein